ncbi:MAG: PAS domain-containing protein, partial [Steroidobacteraceae bacterium]
MSNSRISSDSVLDAVNGGIIVLDLSRRVVLWNTWMRAASGVAEDEARGKSLEEIFAQAALRRLSAAISVALTSNASTILTHALNPNLLPLKTHAGR